MEEITLTTPRICLMCNKSFLSSGKHNRRCKDCEKKVSSNSRNSYYIPEGQKMRGSVSTIKRIGGKV